MADITALEAAEACMAVAVAAASILVMDIELNLLVLVGLKADGDMVLAALAPLLLMQIFMLQQEQTASSLSHGRKNKT